MTERYKKRFEESDEHLLKITIQHIIHNIKSQRVNTIKISDMIKFIEKGLRTENTEVSLNFLEKLEKIL